MTVAEKDLDKAEVDFRAAVAKIDKAGARRVLHPNTAARRKSKLARDYAAAVAKAKSSLEAGDVSCPSRSRHAFPR